MAENETETVLVVYPRGLLDRKKIRLALSNLLVQEATAHGIERPSWVGENEVVLPHDRAEEFAESLLRERQLEIHIISWPEKDELRDKFDEWGRIHQGIERGVRKRRG